MAVVEIPTWQTNDVNFFDKTGTLLIGVGGPDLLSTMVKPAELAKLIRHGFEPKKEPHITVLSYGNGDNILQALKSLPTKQKRAVVKKIGKEAEVTDWSWKAAGQLYPFRGRQRGGLKIVGLVECPAINDYYDWLEDFIPELELERHPPHITLLKSTEEVNRRSRLRIGGIAIGRPLTTLDNLAQPKDKQPLQPVLRPVELVA